MGMALGFALGLLFAPPVRRATSADCSTAPRPSVPSVAAPDARVDLPVNVVVRDELTRLRYGVVFEFRNTSVSYDRESLELQLAFDYNCNAPNIVPQLHVDISDKNDVVLASSASVEITHVEAMAKTRPYVTGAACRLVSLESRNTLSFVFARRDYADAVKSRLVIEEFLPK